MRSKQPFIWNAIGIVTFLAIVFVHMGCATPPEREGEQVEIIRDRWGIPHVYGRTEEGLFFGAGYAMAEDRMFQMMLRRRVAQGRLAEILGPGPENRYLELDRQFRIFGFHVLAPDLLASQDEDTRRNLEAFASGINAYLQDQRGNLLPLFDRYGGHPEPWTAADSISVFHMLGTRFMGGWQKELLAKQGRLPKTTREPDVIPKAVWPNPDSAAQIVSEEEFKRAYPDAYERLMAKKAKHRPQASNLFVDQEYFKASQNWLVNGSKSTTGLPIMGSDPQIPLESPNFGYEMHLVGGRYNIRGYVIAIGAPGILIGWNNHAAWGATALGGDNGDLFEEKVNSQNPDQYAWKEDWKEFEKRTEMIRVKGGDSITLEVRSTHHGPVVNDLLDGVPEGEVYALQTSASNAKRSSLEGMLKMMRATDWASFREGMSQYASPAAHVIYADRHNDIGYQSLVQTPERYSLMPFPRKGWTGEDEWKLIPFDELPSLHNPLSNVVYSANHLSAGSWYPHPVGSGRGRGPRGERIHEIITQDRKFSVEDFIEVIHKDTVNTTLRDFILVAIKVIEEDGVTDSNIRSAVAELEHWDYRYSTDTRGYALARGILEAVKNDMDNTWWLRYGGTWAGLSMMFREMMPAFHKSGKTPRNPEVRQWLKDYFSKGVALAPDFEEEAKNGHIYPMPYQANWLGIESLAPEHDLDSPPLVAPIVQSIWSQTGQTYSQVVDFSNLDGSLSVIAPGISEDPSSPHFKDQMDLWAKGDYHPAPLSRVAVEAIQESKTRLNYPGLPD